MAYKDFLEEFHAALPTFIQGNSREISQDIIEFMKQAACNDGIEIRGFFAMKSEKGNIRTSVSFKDLTK